MRAAVLCYECAGFWFTEKNDKFAPVKKLMKILFHADVA